MSNTRRGHDFEREVKKLFTDADWGCMRGAGSKSGVKGKNHADLIAFARSPDDGLTPAFVVFGEAGYDQSPNTSLKPFDWLASQMSPRDIRHVYYSVVHSDTRFEEGWTVVLIQCKIGKRW